MEFRSSLAIFRSGHLPSGSIPVSYGLSLEEDSDFDSDMDESSNAHFEKQLPDKHSRSSSSGLQKARKFGPLPTRLPQFHASGQGPWHCVLAYDACVRLCLHSWARGCMEAPSFLENECALLRKAFGYLDSSRGTTSSSPCFSSLLLTVFVACAVGVASVDTSFVKPQR